MDKPIDFVIMWVDGSDPAWQAEKARCNPDASPGDSRAIRYRDWDNLMYWFRSVETFTPWVNRVHFVTWGHLPRWLNTDCPKLNVVKHAQFMPEKYLPTFSSRALEVNLHRIPGLAQQFVYFNDDMFITRPMKAEDFFLNGLPRDCGVLCPYPVDVRNSISAIVCNNMEIINTTFDRKKTLRDAPGKWFNRRYHALNRYTLASLVFKGVTGFWGSHFPNNYLKSTYETLWAREYAALDLTSSHAFRDKRDLNQWIVRYWQLAANQFIPRDVRGRKYFPLKSENPAALEAIKKQTYDMICLNDREGIEDFERQRDLIKQAFECILPKKSAFEK